MSAAEQPIKRFIAITAGATDYPSGRLFTVYATVAGDVVLRMWGGGTHTINVSEGYSAFPYAVVGVTTSGTTATATYANGI